LYRFECLCKITRKEKFFVMIQDENNDSVRIGPRVVSHWTPSTSSAPLKGKTNKSTRNLCFPRCRGTCLHTAEQESSSLLPTRTWNPCAEMTLRPRNLAFRSCMKLWVLPLSTNTVIDEELMRPKTRNVCEIEWPNKALKLIWAGMLSGGSDGSIWSWFSDSNKLVKCSSVFSGSAINNKNCFLHLWPGLYFLSQ